MGPIIIPRVAYNLAKGYLRAVPGKLVGIGPDNPHYQDTRVGIFDVDFLGHMNNAQVFSHAEMARWVMTAENGIMKTMWANKADFMVTGQIVRYRRELRPLFRKIQIESYVCGLDDKNTWIYQTFRYPAGDQSKGKESRVRAQLLVQGVVVQNRKVVNPIEFFAEKAGMDRGLLESLEKSARNPDVESLIAGFKSTEESFRHLAASDDQLYS